MMPNRWSQDAVDVLEVGHALDVAGEVGDGLGAVERADTDDVELAVVVGGASPPPAGPGCGRSGTTAPRTRAASARPASEAPSNSAPSTVVAVNRRVSGTGAVPVPVGRSTVAGGRRGRLVGLGRRGRRRRARRRRRRPSPPHPPSRSASARQPVETRDLHAPASVTAARRRTACGTTDRRRDDGEPRRRQPSWFQHASAFRAGRVVPAITRRLRPQSGMRVSRPPPAPTCSSSAPVPPGRPPPPGRPGPGSTRCWSTRRSSRATRPAATG